METYECAICHHVITEADKTWDIARETGAALVVDQACRGSLFHPALVVGGRDRADLRR